METETQSLKYAYTVLAVLSDKIGIPTEVRRTAARVIELAYKSDIFHGRKIETVTAAAVYLSFRIHEQPKHVEEMQAHINATQTEFHSCCSMLQQNLMLSVPPAKPIDFIDDFISKINEQKDETLPERVGTLAKELINTTDDEQLNGRDPTVIAGAAIYAAGRQTDTKVNQQTVSGVANVSNVAIRNNYHHFLED